MQTKEIIPLIGEDFVDGQDGWFPRNKCRESARESRVVRGGVDDIGMESVSDRRGETRDGEQVSPRTLGGPDAEDFDAFAHLSHRRTRQMQRDDTHLMTVAGECLTQMVEEDLDAADVWREVFQDKEDS